MKILVNSFIRKMDKIGIRRSRKVLCSRASGGGRHVVSKFRRAVKMKIAVEDR